MKPNLKIIIYDNRNVAKNFKKMIFFDRIYNSDKTVKYKKITKI